MEFDNIKIEDAIDELIDYRGKTPPKSENGIKLITAKVIKEGRILNDDHEYITSETYQDWMSRGIPQKGDVLITTEAPLGEIAQIRDSEKIALAQRVILLRANKEKIIPNYLYQALKSPITQARLEARATGTTVLGISQKELRKVEIPYFELPVQKRISSILSAYDDLIINNIRRIEILEEMAQRIYREWFVHFRYPGHEDDELVDSDTELGEIPEGWDIVEVQDVIDVNPRTSIDKEKERPYLPMANVSENSMLIDDSDLEYRDGNSGSKFKNYDTLFARITPSLENGKTGFVQFLKSDEQIALGSTEFIVLRSKKLNPYFVYCLARDEQFRKSAIKSMAGASGRQRVRIGTVKEFKVTFPPQNLLRKFKDITESMFMEVGLLSQQNKKLKATRDLLLPKLISGNFKLEYQ